MGTEPRSPLLQRRQGQSPRRRRYQYQAQDHSCPEAQARRWHRSTGRVRQPAMKGTWHWRSRVLQLCRLTQGIQEFEARVRESSPTLSTQYLLRIPDGHESRSPTLSAPPAARSKARGHRLCRWCLPHLPVRPEVTDFVGNACLLAGFEVSDSVSVGNACPSSSNGSLLQLAWCNAPVWARAEVFSMLVNARTSF